MKDCPLVLVEWEDSRQPTPSWNRLSEFQAEDVCKCISIGFLIHDKKDLKVLAPNMADIESETNLQASGMMHIPASAVTRIVCLEETTTFSSSGLALV